MTKRTFLLILVSTFVACSGGTSGGCAGCGDLEAISYPNPAPEGGEVQADVIRAHLPQTLLDFLESHLDSLLNPALTIENGEARFYLDSSVIPADSPIQFREGSYFSFDVDNLNNAIDLQFIPTTADEAASSDPLPAGIRLVVEELELFTDMVIVTELDTDLVPHAACHVRSPGNLPAVRIHNITFDMLIGVAGSGATSHLTVTPSNIEFDLGTDSQEAVITVDITPCDGNDPTDPTCNDAACQSAEANCQEVCGVLDIASDLGDFMLSAIEPVMDQLGQTLESTLGGLISGALEDLPLGIETGMDLGALAGPIFSDAQPLMLKAEASQTFGITGSGPGRGLGMGLNGGITTTSSALCASSATPPNLSELQGPPPAFPSFVELLDDTGASHFSQYHAVLSASGALLSQAAWSAFNGGLLCLSLGTSEIAALTNGEFTFNAGLLINFDAQLLGVAHVDAPMVMRLTAQEQPQIRIGQGHTIATGVHEPLLELTLNDVQIDIHMLIDDTQMRVVGLVSDIGIHLGLERVADNKVQLVIENILVANTTQVYNELAPNADLTGLFEFVIQFAVENFLGDDLSFDLDFSDAISDGIGIPIAIKIATIRRDEGTTGVPYLSVYIKMCSEEDISNPLDYACSTSPTTGANNAPTSDPDLDPQNSFYQPLPSFEGAQKRWVAQTNGIARFRVAEFESREFQFRVNRGAWSSFRTPVNGILEFYTPTLKIMGHHQIELRGRLPNLPQTLETLAPVPVLIDPERPALELIVENDSIAFVIEELVSPDSVSILWREKLEDSFSPWQPVGWSLSTQGLHGEIQIKAIDLSGNESVIHSIYLDEGPKEKETQLTQAPHTARSGCGAVQIPWFIALSFVGFFRRRKRMGY